MDEHELWRRVQSFPFHVPEHAVAGKPKTDHFDWSHIQGQLEIREALEGHLFDEIQLIQTHPAYRGRIRAFERLMKRRGHLDSRIKLGVWQVLYPIIAYIETHGVERSWQEMDAAGELPKYLNAAIRCQELILNRTPDLRRAQEMTAE